MRLKVILLLAVLVSFINLDAQELKSGDSTVVESIKKNTSSIYENRDRTFFFLTNEQLQSVKTYGISLTAHQKDSSFNRIIAISMTPKGQMSTEYFFDSQQLIYIYQTFEFFNESKNQGSWKNFKGLSASESRYYFVDQHLKYQKHKGKRELTDQSSIDDLLAEAARVLNYAINMN